jgi:hypothetical protein
MPRYRKRPAIVEAEQFLPDVTPWPEGVYSAQLTMWAPIYHFIDCPEGQAMVRPGDWILTEANGDRWRCPPDDFAAEWEPVEEGECPAGY